MGDASMDSTFALLPPAPAHNPVKQATARANELGEKSIATTLGYFATMPASTGIIANPVLYHQPVDCNGTTITLDIRSFTIRGVIDRKSTRLNSSHSQISYAVFCLKKKKNTPS